jgi:hypothetical protein
MKIVKEKENETIPEHCSRMLKSEENQHSTLTSFLSGFRQPVESPTLDSWSGALCSWHSLL